MKQPPDTRVTPNAGRSRGAATAPATSAVAPPPTLPLRWPTAETPAPDTPADQAPAPDTPADQAAAPDTPADPPTNSPARPEVEVRTSARRRKTSAAYWERGRIVVILPAHVREPQRTELIDWLVARVLARRPGATASDRTLAERAATLADRYVDGVRPRTIRWVGNQGRRWGSCTSSTGDIRISDRLRTIPDWVLDATIVHELAHLVHPDHSQSFHRIADRFPRQREAAIFLEGYALGLACHDQATGIGGPQTPAQPAGNPV
ncbi:MAG: M48 metallopeptidase family protein [Acidimicrobiales bacterium]